jgi:hypothetical protein
MMNDGGATNMMSGAPLMTPWRLQQLKEETMARWEEEITS